MSKVGNVHLSTNQTKVSFFDFSSISGLGFHNWETALYPVLQRLLVILVMHIIMKSRVLVILVMHIMMKCGVLVFLAMHIVMEMQNVNDSCHPHCDGNARCY